MDTLQWLETYFLNCCNGDWERQYSINIDTLDNPGWRLDICLEGTPFKGKFFQEIEEDHSDNNWFFSLIREKKFVCRGGPQNLRELIRIFADWVALNSKVVALTNSQDSDELEWLENYYLSCCNGDWEHQNGAKIDSLPDPGWHFQFELEEYIQYLPPFEKVDQNRGEGDWINCFTEDQRFIGTCAPKNLRELIRIFKAWVESETDA